MIRSSQTDQSDVSLSDVLCEATWLRLKIRPTNKQIKSYIFASIIVIILPNISKLFFSEIYYGALPTLCAFFKHFLVGRNIIYGRCEP